MVLMALGRLVSGSLASAAVVPISSMPTKANKAIWKPAKNPKTPLGNHPPYAHRFATDAVCPETEEVKPVSTMYTPTAIIARMAITLMEANQNSISPNRFTETRFRPMIRSTTRIDGTQTEMAGNQKWKYEAMAMTSAVPVTTQQNQYVHPTKNPPTGR